MFVDSIFRLKSETKVHKKGVQYLLENALANPTSDIAYYFCALALNRCGEYEKAVIYAEKAISLSPHPRNYFQLANAYWGQGDDVSCLKVLRKMLEVDPMDFYEAHRAMAVVYREQGKEKQAAKMESRLEALRDHRKSLNSEPALVRDGEFRYSLFKY